MKEKIIEEIFIDRLQSLIKEKNLNIVQFSKSINIPKTTVYSWIDNFSSPNLTYLIMIANFFGTTVDYLVGNSERI